MAGLLYFLAEIPLYIYLQTLYNLQFFMAQAWDFSCML